MGEFWRCPQPGCNWINQMADPYKAAHGIPNNECLNCACKVADVALHTGHYNPWYSAWEYVSPILDAIIE